MNLAFGVGINQPASSTASAFDPIENLPVGTVGAGDYAGYTLAYLESFNGSLADLLVRPGNPFGILSNNFSERDRQHSSITSVFTLASQYFTGVQDSGDGAAVSTCSDVLTVGGGYVSCSARQATTGEKALMGTRSNASGPTFTDRPMLAAHPTLYNSFAVRGQRIVEIRWRYDNGGISFTSAGNPAAAIWFLNVRGGSESTSSPGSGWVDEMDGWEYHISGGQAVTRYATSSISTSSAWGQKNDGTWQVTRWTWTATQVVIQNFDDNFNQLGTASLTNSSGNLDALYYAMFGAFNDTSNKANSAAFDLSVWNGGKSQRLDVSSIRVWSPLTTLSPLLADATLTIEYGASATLTLPTQTSLWGIAVDSEFIEAISATDTNGPGRSTEYVSCMETRSALPIGVTYSGSGTRILAFAPDFTTQSGISHFCVYPAASTSGVSKPWHIAVYVKPKIQISKLGLVTAGSSYSYQLVRGAPRNWDNGNCPQGLHSGLTLVSGPNWLSFDSQTSTLSGSCPGGFSSAYLTFRCTNGAGLFTEQNILLSTADVAAPADVAGLAFAMDATDPASCPDDGSGHCGFARHLYDGTRNLGQKTSANRPSIILNGGPNADSRVLSFATGNYLTSVDGANNSVLYGFLNNANIGNSSGYLVLAAKVNASGVQRLAGVFDSGGSAFFQLRYGSSDRGVSYAGAAQSTVTVAQGSQDTVWHVIELVKSSTSITVRVDGVDVASGTISQTAGLAATMFLLGANNAGSVSGGLNGQVSRLAVFGSVPTVGEQASMRAWAAARPGIVTA